MPLTHRLSVAALAAVLIGAAWHVAEPMGVVAAAPSAPASVAAPARQPNPIHWSIARVGSGAITAGKAISVDVTAEIDAGWHLYGLTEPPGPIPTAITIPKGGPFTIDGDIGVLPPKRAFDQGFGVETEFYEEHATFTVPVKIAAGTKGKQTLTIEAMYQTCNDRLCLPPTTQKITLELTIGGTGH